MRRALITGIAGQDGSYLAELAAGQVLVHGIVRRVSRRGLHRVVVRMDRKRGDEFMRAVRQIRQSTPDIRETSSSGGGGHHRRDRLH